MTPRQVEISEYVLSRGQVRSERRAALKVLADIQFEDAINRSKAVGRILDQYDKLDEEDRADDALLQQVLFGSTNENTRGTSARSGSDIDPDL